MTDDDRDREKLRLECREDLAALRSSELPERAFRLLEKLTDRLDRLETGSFTQEERPTEPQHGRVRKASGAIPAFRAETVIAELEKGKNNE
jgi:hypothetical protein